MKAWLPSSTPGDVRSIEFKHEKQHSLTLRQLTHTHIATPFDVSITPGETLPDSKVSDHHLVATHCPATLIWSHAAPTLCSPLLRMFGEWDVMAKYAAFDTPLGAAFVDPSFLEAARAPVEQGGLGSSTPYKMRLFSTLPDTWDNNVSARLAAQPRAEGQPTGGAPAQSLPACRAANEGSATMSTDRHIPVSWMACSSTSRAQMTGPKGSASGACSSCAPPLRTC